jgi:Ca2+-binding RTX toxin-like protein
MTFTGAVSLVINGTSGVDIIKMGHSVNTINAGDGTDQIRGGNLVDTINGGGGGDKIMGRGGADVITGGLGDDRFRYIDNADSGFGAARDRITDFTSGQDLIDFSWFDGDAVTAGDQAFTFVGTAAFSNTGLGQLRYASSGGDILLQADTNGDGVADMEIILQGIGASTLTAADFIL